MCQEYLLINLREIPFKKDVNRAVLDISVDPHDVLCFLITPKRMDLKPEGDKIRVNLSGVKAKELWVAAIEVVIERENLPSNARKLLLRLPLPHSAEDIASFSLNS